MGAAPSACLLVLVTCPSRAVGRRIAERVVRSRLAACVNLLPGVESRFWWNGKVDRAGEALLLIKTTAARFEALRRAVIRLHPYDVPEVIAVPFAAGHRPYLRWVRASVTA
jgi:periplasmic divalent cation tolerance protein